MMYKTVFTGFPRTERVRDNVASSYIIKKEERRGGKN